MVPRLQTDPLRVGIPPSLPQSKKVTRQIQEPQLLNPIPGEGTGGARGPSEEEFEVEDIIAHTEYLVEFKGYGPEDNLWLLQRNLEHAPEILRASQAWQTNDLSLPAQPDRAQQAPHKLK